MMQEEILASTNEETLLDDSLIDDGAAQISSDIVTKGYEELINYATDRKKPSARMQEENGMRLGPEGYENIAILGSAPSSILLAPFDDPTWSIWGTSPSCWAQLQGRRTDVWFEVHNYRPYPPGQSTAPGTKPWFSPEFNQWLREHKGTVFMTEGHPDIPGCVQYPFKEMIAKHGEYHFGSSVPEMLALAIEQMPKSIGLFGVDMAAGEEWAYQRPACQHFIGVAHALGIEIVLPPESDLMRPNLVYGLGEHTPMYIKLDSRINELVGQQAQILQTRQQMVIEEAAVNAALDAFRYIQSTWSGHNSADYN
ncbi:MAG TPA: hypothetical protein ENI05_06190, partial [Porticoccus sp.]|nr:hypothetical protein [Porticoccus sp.]